MYLNMSFIYNTCIKYTYHMWTMSISKVKTQNYLVRFKTPGGGPWLTCNDSTQDILCGQRPKAYSRHISCPLDNHRLLAGLWPPKNCFLSFFLDRKTAKKTLQKPPCCCHTKSHESVLPTAGP